MCIFFQLVQAMKATVPFYTAYLLCLVLSLVCVVLVIHWNFTYLGGFSWDGKITQFNWHPVLMVIGLVVMYGNGEGQKALFMKRCEEDDKWVNKQNVYVHGRNLFCLVCVSHLWIAVHD